MSVKCVPLAMEFVCVFGGTLFVFVRLKFVGGFWGISMPHGLDVARNKIIGGLVFMVEGGVGCHDHDERSC